MGLLAATGAPTRATAPMTLLPPRRDFGAILITLAVAVGAVIMITPLIWMILSSLKSQAEILQATPSFFPHQPGLNAYHTILTDGDNPVLTWFRNSVIVSVAVTASVLFTSALAGYVFAKFRFFGKNVLFLMVLASLMVPFQVLIIPLLLIVRNVGMFNTLWALIVPSATSAFGIYLMRQFMEGIPNALIEAGRIDGSSEFGIYWRIILPQVVPAMTALGIFTFKFMWNDYLWPLVAINDSAHQTLALGLAQYTQGQHGTRFDLTLALSTLSALPIIVLFLIFQRQFVQGIALSGLKG